MYNKCNTLHYIEGFLGGYAVIRITGKILLIVFWHILGVLHCGQVGAAFFRALCSFFVPPTTAGRPSA